MNTISAQSVIEIPSSLAPPSIKGSYQGQASIIINAKTAEVWSVLEISMMWLGRPMLGLSTQ